MPDDEPVVATRELSVPAKAANKKAVVSVALELTNVVCPTPPTLPLPVAPAPPPAPHQQRADALIE